MSTEPPSEAGPEEEPLSVEVIRRRARRMAWLYAAAAIVLIPWTAFLASSLPGRSVDTHYRAAWVGFDVLLVLAIVLTAYYAFEVDTRVQLPATATATLLLVDAWFDIMTAGGRRETVEAVILAACFEIPAALFSLFLARRVNHNAVRVEAAKAALVMAHSADDEHRYPETPDVSG